MKLTTTEKWKLFEREKKIIFHFSGSHTLASWLFFCTNVCSHFTHTLVGPFQSSALRMKKKRKHNCCGRSVTANQRCLCHHWSKMNQILENIQTHNRIKHSEMNPMNKNKASKKNHLLICLRFDCVFWIRNFLQNWNAQKSLKNDHQIICASHFRVAFDFATNLRLLSRLKWETVNCIFQFHGK